MVALERGTPATIPITPPNALEVAALSRVAAYLDRAASEAGTQLLGRNTLDGDAALLAALRESLLHSAGLCADLLDLAAQHGEPAAWVR